MTYAYLFKYIIIGDTGNPPTDRLRSWGGDPTSKIGLGAGRGERSCAEGAGRAPGAGLCLYLRPCSPSGSQRLPG